MRTVVLLFLLSCLLSCSKKESEVPKPDPGSKNKGPSPNLIYPTDNLLCLAPDITFSWNKVDDPDDDPVIIL